MEGYGVGLLLIIEDRRAIARQSGGLGALCPLTLISRRPKIKLTGRTVFPPGSTVVPAICWRLVVNMEEAFEV